MLWIPFRLGDRRFAILARDVAAVVPLVPCDAIPGAPAWVVGVFPHRGELVPVVDLGALVSGQPSPAVMSTRILLVRHESRLIGLVGEHVTTTFDLPDEAAPEEVLHLPETPFLGRVLSTPQGLYQTVTLSELLTPQVKEMLFPNP